MADKQDELNRARICHEHFIFSDETPDEVDRVIKSYEENFTSEELLGGKQTRRMNWPFEWACCVVKNGQSGIWNKSAFCQRGQKVARITDKRKIFMPISFDSERNRRKTIHIPQAECEWRVCFDGNAVILRCSQRKNIKRRCEPRTKPLKSASNSALQRRGVEILFAKPIRARVKQRPSRCASGSLSFLVLLNRFFFLALLSMWILLKILEE